jgi:hypothetical protein
MLGCCGGTPPADSYQSAIVRWIGLWRLRVGLQPLPISYRTVTYDVVYTGHPEFNVTLIYTLPAHAYNDITQKVPPATQIIGNPSSAGWDWLLFTDLKADFFPASSWPPTIFADGYTYSPDATYPTSTVNRQYTGPFNDPIAGILYPVRERWVTETLSDPIIPPKAAILADLAGRAVDRGHYYYGDGTYETDGPQVFGTLPSDGAYWQYKDALNYGTWLDIQNFYWQFADPKPDIYIAAANHHAGPGADAGLMTCQFNRSVRIKGQPVCLVKYAALASFLDPRVNPPASVVPDVCTPNVKGVVPIEVYAGTSLFNQNSRTGATTSATRPACCNIAP